MKFKPSDKFKQVAKFEIKLLLAVMVGSLILFWVVTTVINKAGAKVAEAYTSTQPLFK